MIITIPRSFQSCDVYAPGDDFRILRCVECTGSEYVVLHLGIKNTAL